MTVANSTFTGNTAGYRGGGIDGSGTVTATNSTFTENTAGWGGGIYGNGTLTVTNSLIAGNTAINSGGGIDNRKTMTMTNSTITGNTAVNYGGDGISNGSSSSVLTMANTIVVGNGEEEINNYYGDARIYGYNNLTTFDEWTDGSENIVYTPGMLLFVDAANGNYRLADGSPAIDNGDNDRIPDGIIADLDYSMRIHNGTVDIGAYEYGAASLIVPLAAPANVTAIGKNSTTITVSWAAVANNSGYLIQYATDASFTQNVQTQRAGSTSQSSDITGLTTGTIYYFRVLATGVGEYGTSPYSDSVIVIVPSVPPLAVPTGVGAICTNATTMNVKWNSVSNASGYVIQYATDEYFTQDVREQNVSGGSVKTANVTSLATDTTYYVRIMATGTGNYNDSPYSSSVSVRVEPTVEAVPDPVKASGVKNSVSSISNATLTWKNNDRNAEYVIVCTSHTGIAPQTVMGNSVTFEGLQPGTSYKFTVVAKNADGKEAAAVKVSAKTQKFTAVKMGKATSTLGVVTLNWVASPFAETTGYEVYRVDPKTKVETLVWEGNATAATINDLAPGTKHSFVVRAIAADLNIQSANAKASAATQKYVAVKKGKSASTTTSITLNWNASLLSETTGYEVYRVDPKTKAETKVWEGTGTTATIEELLAGTKYTFVVRAVSSDLNIKSANTKISASTAK